MTTYTSGITFLYYEDYDKATFFFESILKLEIALTNSFGKVYKISEGAFVGAIKKSKSSVAPSYTGGTLVSLTTSDASTAYQEIKQFELPYISKLEIIESIPLKSFFFKDFEGHDFEIQEFLKKEIQDIF